MKSLKFGEIVLLKFPFTDGKRFRKRPALVINDFGDGDIIVCRITSRIYETKNDVFIEEWKDFGLKLPSVIRVHKLATLEKNMVDLIIGEIDTPLKNQIEIILSELTA